MKRSVNFRGSRQTQHRKAMQPAALLKLMKFVGWSDKEATEFLKNIDKRNAEKGK